MRTLAGVVVVMVCVGAVVASGAALPGTHRHTAAMSVRPETIPVGSWRAHTVGDIWLAVANNSTFGSTGSYSETAPPANDSVFYVSCEFPGGSGNEHLFLGGLWIGGIFGNDTLTSEGLKAGSASTYEFNGFAPIQVGYDPSHAHQTFGCRYYDTMIVPPALDDGLLHRPLGLQVDQRTHAFASPPCDQFILLEYLVRNISSVGIQNVRIGFMLDADVGNESRQGGGESWPSDDLSGFLGEIGAAYTMDNNGDPQGDSVVYTPVYSRTPRTDTIWDRWSCRSAIGIAPVFFDPPPACTTFNWWGLNYSTIDWGPTQEFDPRWGVHSEAPRSDPELYEVMGNREIDYDQLAAAVDHTSDGWQKPLSPNLSTNIANGLDTRFVLAYCFGDLAPGDSLCLVMVLAAGDSVHREPTDFAHYFDPAHPEIYRSLLDFSNLTHNVQLARAVWNNAFDLVGAAPARLTLTPKSDRSVRCIWSEAPFQDVTGYRLYRRRVGDSAWTVAATLDLDHISLVDKNLTPGVTYEYAVSSLYGNHQEGPRSHDKSIRIGLPLDVPTITAKNTPHLVGLNWIIPTAGPTYSPYEFLNIYRRTDTDTSDTPYRRIRIYGSLGSAGEEPNAGLAAGAPRRDRYGFSPYALTDDSVTSGVTYFYSASLTNTLGLEGVKSSEVNATPMMMDHPGIVLFSTSDLDDFVLLDSVHAFYSVWAEKYGFDTLEIVNIPYSEISSRLMLTRLSHYKCVVLVMEDPYSRIPELVHRTKLATFLGSGGSGVFVARNHKQPSSYGGPSIYPDPLIQRFLGVRRVLYERFYDRVEPLNPSSPHFFAARFIGAAPFDLKYPAIEGDSLEAWSPRTVRFLWNSDIPDSLRFGAGYVIAVGAADSLEPGTEVLYSYVSAYDTSVFQGKPVAVKRITDSSAAILFNFPLSLMKHEAAWRALSLAVADLGIDTSHYEPPAPANATAAIIRWLYHPNAGNPRPGWDLNRDGIIDVRDVVESTNSKRLEQARR